MPKAPDSDLDARFLEQAKAVRKLIDARLLGYDDFARRLTDLTALVNDLIKDGSSAASLQSQLNSVRIEVDALRAELTTMRTELNRQLEASTRSITKRQVARLMREKESANG